MKTFIILGLMLITGIASAGVVIGEPKERFFDNGGSHYNQAKQKAHKERVQRHQRIDRSACKRGYLPSCAALQQYELNK